MGFWTKNEKKQKKRAGEEKIIFTNQNASKFYPKSVKFSIKPYRKFVWISIHKIFAVVIHCLLWKWQKNSKTMKTNICEGSRKFFPMCFNFFFVAFQHAAHSHSTQLVVNLFGVHTEFRVYSSLSSCFFVAMNVQQ